MDLRTYSAAEVTILLIDIKGFTAQCAAMSAGRVGQWVLDFYERVAAAAAVHGVSKLETRGDCCVCVAGAEGAVPSLSVPATADRRCDQATRMLAFAAALHTALSTASPPANGFPPLQTRMGIATGPAAFLVSAAGQQSFASAQGPAVRVAARMEALAAPGLARVHSSAAEKWAAEARRPPPPTVAVECEGDGPQRAAAYDCAAGAFRPADPPPLPGPDSFAVPARPAAPAAPARMRAGGLRVSASALF
jgi:class 3 adenylate cyclase